MLANLFKVNLLFAVNILPRKEHFLSTIDIPKHEKPIRVNSSSAHSDIDNFPVHLTEINYKIKCTNRPLCVQARQMSLNQRWPLLGQFQCRMRSEERWNRFNCSAPPVRLSQKPKCIPYDDIPWGILLAELLISQSLYRASSIGGELRLHYCVSASPTVQRHMCNRKTTAFPHLAGNSFIMLLTSYQFQVRNNETICWYIWSA